MRRFTIAWLAAFACLPVALAGGAAPRATLRSFVCQRALDPGSRAVEVTAVMRPLAGTRHMAIKFVLLERAARHAPLRRVAGHGLGRWLSPKDPNLGQLPGDVWVLKKPVVYLEAGQYRLRVLFRWTGDGGHVLGRTARQTPICVQPELRPDLRVTAISVQPVAGAPGQDLYTAALANAGRTATGPFDVQLSINDELVATKSVKQLGPHSGTEVRFYKAACNAGAPITVVADPDGAVDDFDRSNNQLTVVCPG